MSISWPAQSESKTKPIWTGEDFLIGNENFPILCYHETESGWTNNLTEMHEEASGDNHFIDVASRHNAIKAISPILKQKNPVILEIGCSSGFFLEELHAVSKNVNLVGSDFISGPLHKLADRLKGVPIVQFDITQCPLEDNSFDAIVMLNVLEHIKDDSKALSQVFRILKPGGIAFIEVPAGPHLYDFYDKHLMHFRRYRLKDLKILAQNAGFKIIKASHLGFFLYPLFAAVKKLNIYKSKKMSVQHRQKLVSQQIKQSNSSAIMHSIMKIESALGNLINFPTGIRCVLTLKKP